MPNKTSFSSSKYGRRIVGSICARGAGSSKILVQAITPSRDEAPAGETSWLDKQLLTHLLVEAEHGLLPVHVLCVRARGEVDELAAGAEVDVGPGDQSVGKVATIGERERVGGEGNSMQVE